MTRPIDANYKTSSVTVSGAGAVAEAAGTDDASAYSTTRAATGGPPLIAINLVEICWVKMFDDEAAVIPNSDILKQANVHREVEYNPSYVIDYHAGKITYSAAIMANHTGSVPKNTYVDYSIPIFTELDDVRDATVPTITHSQTEQPVYGSVKTAITQTKDQGGFTIMSKGDLNEALEQLDNITCWIKVKPISTKTKAYTGIGAISRKVSIPSDNFIEAVCTITGVSDFKTEAG